MLFATKLLSLAASLALLATGCVAAEPAQSPVAAKLPDPGPDQEYEVNFPDPGHGVARYIRIAIGEDLSKSCGLMRTHFAFDSAKLSPQDQAILRSVAECLERPGIEGLQLAIVGRADARGGSAYNADLGLRRAQSVKKLLVDAGIAESRISIDSQGKTGALGTNAPSTVYSHGYDRRVDIVLLGTTHQPL